MSPFGVLINLSLYVQINMSLFVVQVNTSLLTVWIKINMSLLTVWIKINMSLLTVWIKGSLLAVQKNQLLAIVQIKL